MIIRNRYNGQWVNSCLGKNHYSYPQLIDLIPKEYREEIETYKLEIEVARDQVYTNTCEHRDILSRLNSTNSKGRHIHKKR
jgi:hypothetical protein